MVRIVKQTIAMSSLALFVGMFSSSVWAEPDLSTYQIVFSDEFTGTSLDTTKWATSPIWGPFLRTNNEDQYYLDKAGLDEAHPVDPFSFDGDILTITATPVGTDVVPVQPPENDDTWNQYPEYTFNENYLPENRSHFSGLISSVNSFTFTHGYAEARIRVPGGQGLWPAFWQLTHKYVEDAPEIDIMETLGQYPNEVNHTMHYFDTANNWALISTPTYTTSGPNYTQEFHTYGMLWAPESVTWFVDGVEVQRIERSEFTIPKQAMYIIANLAVGGTWPGPPDSTTPFPAELNIDYIRVYQRTPPEQITPETLATNYQLMFSDEFTGSVLDATKWNTSFLWGPHLQINNEEQVYVDTQDTHSTYGTSPFEVSNGTLKITAEPVAQTDLPVQPPESSPYWDSHPERTFNADYNNTWIPSYTSGIITSYDSFKFVHGYVEYNARLPSGDGLWPAFWLLSGYYVGPIPEIDILETQGEVPNASHHSYHYFDTDGTPISSASIYELPTGDFSDGFHRFGVKWHPGEIIWYVDGVPVRTLTGPEVSLQLMYLLANLAVGGNFVGPVGDAFPATLEIDYVRAYQLREYPVAAPPPPQEPPNSITPIGPLSSISTATPNFEWEDLGSVDEYRLLIHDLTSGVRVHLASYDSGAICSAGSCSVIPNGLNLDLGANYFWRVRARNAAGWNAWSSANSFIYTGDLPGLITPITPLVSTATATPSFEWEDLGSVDEYRLLIHDLTSGVRVHLASYDSGAICSAGGCSVIPNGLNLDLGANYFWRVRARNAAGWNAWSSANTFEYAD